MTAGEQRGNDEILCSKAKAKMKSTTPGAVDGVQVSSSWFHQAGVWQVAFLTGRNQGRPMGSERGEIEYDSQLVL